MPPNKVTSACVRCRKQKLKCDVERPCIMCSRAGVECVRRPQVWYNHNQGPAQRAQTTSRSVDESPRPKRRRRTPPTEQSDDFGRPSPSPSPSPFPAAGSTSSLALPALSPGKGLGSKGKEQSVPTDNESWGNSTSTVMLVEEAFHHHDTASPETSETSAICYSQNPRNSRLNVNPQKPSRRPTGLGTPMGLGLGPGVGYGRVYGSLATEFASLLPNREAVTVLVDNYFNKIHWFMLLFHQREFRVSFDKLYANGRPTDQTTGQQDDKPVGYIAVLLATCALSLRYISPNQKALLTACGIDPGSQRERILGGLRLRLLDILALGSLEAVQVCVLLGSYYLYHGEPELAWPLCGCALRLSQALDLHQRPTRRVRASTESQAPSTSTSLSQKSIEARKRCWWAVHEIETFCSMVYGFPLSISDADCDAEPLDPSDPWSIAADGQSSSSDQPSLLVYKCSMSELSKIVKSAIEGLYSSRRDSNKRHKGDDGPASNRSTTRVQALIQRVTSLDAELVRWYERLPPKLRLGKLAHHRQEGSSNLSFDEKLLRLQALALKLAFENARILVHRPLLSYKVSFSSTSAGDPGTSRRDPYLASVHVCRDAALQISFAGHVPVFQEASTTYALNFISLHILTAGVTLCIMASLNPLSQDSLESKLGIRRLMEMQVSLKPDSLVADQGLEILKKLSSLVMKKETKMMLTFGSRETEQGLPNLESEALHTGSDSHGEPLASTNHNSPSFQDSRQHAVFSATPGASPDRAIQRQTQTQTQTRDVQEEISCFTNLAADMEVSSFCEDILMTETMFDVEQAMGYSGHRGATHLGDMTTELDEQISAHEIIGYDRSWLWGPTMSLGNTEFGE